MLPFKSNWIFFNFILISFVNSEIMPTKPLGNKVQGDMHYLQNPVPLKTKTCNLNRNLIEEIANYTNVANQIFQTILTGSFKSRTYNDLAYFVDTFGHRLAGSDSLENSIDFMMQKMRDDGLENVHAENVSIPHWIRGYERATLITPRIKNIALLGLGLTVGTTGIGILAQVLVVKSFDDLKKHSSKAKGRIVVFNQDFIDFYEAVQYQKMGAVEASKYGAVASLIRSITDFSINTPHAGTQYYQTGVKKIPTAFITVEDAQFLNRLQDRGQMMFLHLKMLDSNLQPTTSRNICGEIAGRETPDEVVLVTGHIDSWDVGQGAMDDGGGIFIAEEALAVLKHLKLRPRRTIRVILWTAEEIMKYGVKSYVKDHINELEKINVIFESDLGTFKPLGLNFNGTEEAGCIVQEVMKLLAPLNATTYKTFATQVSSIQEFISRGVPGITGNTEMDRYLRYHHTEADTMSVENTEELDLCTAVWTVASYVLADLSVSLPRI